LQQLGYSNDSPKSKTNEGMDEMLAALQASSSNETAKQAIEHMDMPLSNMSKGHKSGPLTWNLVVLW
jgi:hypothetical protein